MQEVRDATGRQIRHQACLVHGVGGHQQPHGAASQRQCRRDDPGHTMDPTIQSQFTEDTCGRCSLEGDLP